MRLLPTLLMLALLASAGRGDETVAPAPAPDASDDIDLYLVKVDEEGNEIWSHTYGSPGTELGRAVQQTADGGYILIGSTTSVRDTSSA